MRLLAIRSQVILENIQNLYPFYLLAITQVFKFKLHGTFYQQSAAQYITYDSSVGFTVNVRCHSNAHMNYDQAEVLYESAQFNS